MSDEKAKVTFRRPAKATPASSGVSFCQEMRLRDERRREEKELKGKNKQWGYEFFCEDEDTDDDNSVPDWFE